MMTSSTHRSDLSSSLEILEVKPGLRFSKATLQELLPDVETALFFSKAYDLDYTQVSSLLASVFGGNQVIDELFSGAHSTSLQNYLVGGYQHEDDCDWTDDPEFGYGSGCTCSPTFTPGILPEVKRGDVVFDPTIVEGEVLRHVFDSLQVEVAKSIKEVASKLSTVVARMPGKQGQMVFNSMMVMNRKRPTIGDYKASIHHERQAQNLLIFDVSGSMSEPTVKALVTDVVDLAYMANANLAIVSNSCYYWEAGNYDVDAVLKQAEYGGTYYEELAELMQLDWGTVITVADYDSSLDAKRFLGDNCHGSIEEVIDISLVNQPTFLAECVGQFAKKVTPILIGSSPYVLA